MGIDLGQMFGDAKNTVLQGMNDFAKQGGNAAIGYLEGQAIGVIQADQSQHEEAVQQVVTKQLSTPPNPGSFGAYLTGLVQQPVIKQYGLYILGAVGLIVVVTLVARGK